MSKPLYLERGRWWYQILKGGSNNKSLLLQAFGFFCLATGVFGPVWAQRCRFSAGTECWAVTGDGEGPYFRATGGNGGGYLEAKDLHIQQSWYFSAPAYFLGDKSGSLGRYLRYDQRTSNPGASTSGRDVVLSGGGIEIWYNTPVNPGTTWTSMSILLESTGWRYTTSGLEVSDADMLTVLSNLSSLRILGEYSSAVDVGGLDNVVLEPLSSFTYPTAITCQSSCLSFAGYSSLNATSWSWVFPGATPATSTAQNPTNVCFPSAGNYTVTLTTSNGCITDTANQKVRVQGTYRQNLPVFVCKGSTYTLPDGTVTDTATTFVDSLKSVQGCDSLVTLRVSVGQPDSTPVQALICAGQRYLVGSQSFTQTGDYKPVLKNRFGCDSTIQLALEVVPLKTGFRSVTVCEKDTVFDGDTAYLSEGVFTRKLISKPTGCDSMHTTEIKRIRLNLKTLPDTIVEYLAEFNLVAFSPGENLRYAWQPDSLVNCAACSVTKTIALHSTTYLVSVTDTVYQCRANASFAVKVECPVSLPNLLLVNGDGRNDYFYLKDLPCYRKVLSLKVYNRWGNLIFSQADYPVLPEFPLWNPKEGGVYFYLLELDEFEAEPKRYVGWVEVVR